MRLEALRANPTTLRFACAMIFLFCKKVEVDSFSVSRVVHAQFFFVIAVSFFQFNFHSLSRSIQEPLYVRSKFREFLEIFSPVYAGFVL